MKKKRRIFLHVQGKIHYLELNNIFFDHLYSGGTDRIYLKLTPLMTNNIF